MKAGELAELLSRNPEAAIHVAVPQQFAVTSVHPFNRAPVAQVFFSDNGDDFLLTLDLNSEISSTPPSTN